jgi:hypothetical protein
MEMRRRNLGVVVSISRICWPDRREVEPVSLNQTPFWPHQIAHILYALYVDRVFISLSLNYAGIISRQYGKVFLVISNWRLHDHVLGSS